MEKFEKIWIDLREFGWGIREVPVVWPEDRETLGPDTVGTAELKDNGVAYKDLSTEVQEMLDKPVDPEMVAEAVNAAVQEAVPTAVSSAVSEAVTEASEESVRSIVKDWQPEEEPEPSDSSELTI